MATYRHVYFEPWIGPKYNAEGLWGRKVLIVGESHYNEWHNDDGVLEKHSLGREFTSECVSDLIEKNAGARYWNRVRNRIGGDEFRYHQQPQAFWTHVAFYNFIQSPVSGGPGNRPTSEQWRAAGPALLEVLARLCPDRVIVTGKQMWPYIPRRSGKAADIAVEGTSDTIPLEWFEIEPVRKTYVTATDHPASRGGFRISLTPLLLKFIRTDLDNESPGDRDDWSESLQDSTRASLEGCNLASNGNVDLKHKSLAFGYITADNLSRGILKIVDKQTGSETSFASVEELVRSGWVID